MHSNGSYSIVARLFVAAGMCLPSRCLGMSVYSDFTIPAFRRHVTICFNVFYCIIIVQIANKVGCKRKKKYVLTEYGMPKEVVGLVILHLREMFSRVLVIISECGPPGRPRRTLEAKIKTGTLILFILVRHTSYLRIIK
jgi:hypothetical protein